MKIISTEIRDACYTVGTTIDDIKYTGFIYVSDGNGIDIDLHDTDGVRINLTNEQWEDIVADFFDAQP